MSEEPELSAPPPCDECCSQRWLTIVGVLLLAAVVSVSEYYRRSREAERERERTELAAWTKRQPGLAPAGGKYFDKPVQLSVPAFLQGDPRWGDNPLGPSPTDTIASHGCAVASCAMILASYGVDTDPQRLNDFLNLHNGFTPEAWLKWEVAATLSPDKVRFVYEDDPSYQLIDENLQRGNPVIIRIRYASGITHFVVICGKNGYDYLINDPGRHGGNGPIPLKDLDSNIEALRFYEPVKPA